MAATDYQKVGKRHSLSELLTKKSLTGTTALLAYLGLADFVAHMVFAGNYGYFRDELYYIVSGTQHLSLGYVDFPPMIAYVAAFLNIFSQDSLVTIHVVPALVEAMLVFIAGMIARELGGGRKAQLLAAVSTIVALVFLAVGSEFSPDSLDQLWWSLLAYLTVRLVKRKEPRIWIPIGLVVGVGLLSKATMFFFVGALLVSFLVIPSSRKYLRSKWVVVGGLLSIALVLPMIYWNLVNGWPMVHFYLEFTGDFGGGGPVNFLTSQLTEINYLNIPIFLIGLYFYLRSDQGSELRALGLSYLLLYVLMTVLNLKPYYLLPIYPMLFAGGALLIERSSISRKGVFRWFGSRPYIACSVIVAILLAPLIMPIFPPSTLVNTYGSSTLSSVNSGAGPDQTGPLPQILGDRVGWNAMVSTLAQVYDGLPANQRAQACIFAGNYGEASAVNLLGKSLGLPAAISGHNNYYIWGPESCTGQVLITVGVSIPANQTSFANVTLLATIKCQYCMDLENNLPVYLITNPTVSLASLWPQLRHYD